MKRSILCCSLALLASGSAWAEITPPTVDADALLAITQQEKTVTGTVVDANGEPIIGANVVVKGTTTGTITDMDGRFTLNVPLNRANALETSILSSQ